MTRRSIVRVTASILLAGLLACSTPTREATPTGSASSSLLFLRGTTLTKLDLVTGKSTKVGTFPTSDVHAASVAPYVAYVVGSNDSGAPEDFVRDPQLRVLDIESRAEDAAGAGVAPMWDATGSRVAYLRPTGERLCDGEACRGLREVMVFEPSTGDSRVLSEPGLWTLLTWAGDRVLAGDPTDLTTTVSLGRGEPVRLPVAPSEVWGAAPDGRWLLVTSRAATRFLGLSPDGTPTGEGVRVLLAGRPADGAWTEDSKKVAAVLLGSSGTRHAVVFGPDDPQPRPIPGSEGAAGQLLWLGDNQVVITRVAPGGRLTTSLCPLDGKGCRELFSWGRGVVLLRTEGQEPPQAE